MAFPEDLVAHLETGHTSVCRCWLVERGDDVVFGFTDHDRDLEFEGVNFRADTGMTARALQQTTGLSVDNSEALGVLSASSITEDDIRAGRFDGARVTAWLVNWADVSQRVVQFRGSLGEITRGAGGFRTELRGLAEDLNQPRGQVYQKPCPAILGDAACQFDLTQPGYSVEGEIGGLGEGKSLILPVATGFEDRWFERGQITVLDGAAEGLQGVIKNDRLLDDYRAIDLWETLPGLASGDLVRLVAGCDKRVETCKLKFDNFLNYRGFPHIPGEDWLISYPTQSGQNDGGSLS